jgi:hypothetical protein
MSDRHIQRIEVQYIATQAMKDAAAFAAAEQKTIQQTANAAIKAAKETAAEQRKAARGVSDAQKAANAALKELTRDETTTARASSRAQAQATKDALRQEMIAFKEKHQLVMMQWKWEQEAALKTAAAQRQSAMATQGAASSIAGMAASMIGVTAGAGALSAIKDIWKGVGDEALRAAAAAAAFHKQERISGTLVGKTAEQVSPEVLGLMTSSGLGQHEADDLFRQFYGSLPAGQAKGNITADVAKQLLGQTAIAAARQGGDAGTKGDLAGILPMFAKVESAQAGLGQLEAIRQALTEGRGDDTPLTKSLLSVAGTMVREGGPVGTLPEMAALVGTTSLTSGPMMADTRALQVMRATRGTTKEQMAKIAKEFGIEAGSKQSLEERLDLMVPKLREVGKTNDLGSWMTTHLGTPQEDSEAMVQIVGNYDVLKKRFASARSGALGGADVETQNRNFLDSELGRQMVSEQKGVAGQYLVGRKTQGAAAMIEAAKALQAAEPPGPNKQIEEMFARGVTLGQWGRAEFKADEMVTAQMRKAGIEGKGPSYRLGTPAIDVIQGKMDFMQNAGLDPFGVSGDLAKGNIEQPLARLIALQEKQLEETKKQNEILRKLAPPAGAAAVPGKAAGDPKVAPVVLVPPRPAPRS